MHVALAALLTIACLVGGSAYLMVRRQSARDSSPKPNFVYDNVGLDPHMKGMETWSEEYGREAPRRDWRKTCLAGYEAPLPVDLPPGLTIDGDGTNKKIRRSKDGAEMVYVPAGKFIRGTSEDLADALWWDRVLKHREIFRNVFWVTPDKMAFWDELPQREIHV